MFELKGRKIWVAGGTGMVGSAIIRNLSKEECLIIAPQRDELDLLDQLSVNQFLKINKPDIVIIAAATVGGILANSTRPAEFIYENITIANNIIHGAHINEINRLLFLGSACIYPREADQPMTEEALLQGKLEPTNEWYAIAKIAGIKMCQAYRKQYGRNYISAQPNNLYGTHDNFDVNSGHVIPALMHRAHLAKVNLEHELSVWGTGSVFREFLHVDDCADALIHLLKFYNEKIPINIGTGEEITIKNLALKICDVLDFKGKLIFDDSKPDGSPRKLLNSERIKKLGWKSKINLEKGLKETYEWYKLNIVPKQIS
ncbi:MAG: GDP-fucose synthetase [Rhodospirillaceae bacterium]|nr:GDP-fucose synthetase [Rhodospirillaceae bacterium]OUT80665.1 MAG: GDP-fucose synthetase [Rhodospirillaceae bacterium TMED23]